MTSQHFPFSDETRRERLKQFARKSGFSADDPRMPSDTLHYTLDTPSDEASATAALQRHRSVKFESKKHFLRRQPSKAAFQSKEIGAVLENVLATNASGSAAEVATLIRMASTATARDRNSMFTKAVDHLHSLDFAGHLVKSVHNDNHEMILTLCPHVEQLARDQALDLALKKRDNKSIRILMNHKADPDACRSTISDLVKLGHRETVGILLCNTHNLKKEFRDELLYQALVGKHIELVKLLMWGGADFRSRSDAAMVFGIQCGRADLLSAVCLSTQPPSPSILARGVAMAVEMIPSDSLYTLEQMRLAEILLASGARGDELSELVIEATILGKKELLIALLISYGASISFRNTEALYQSVIRSDLSSFECLIRGVLKIEAVSRLLLRISARLEVVKLDFRVPIFAAIIQKSLHSRSDDLDHALGVALIAASQALDINLAHTLVEHGASADLQDGQSLKYAISHKSLELVNILLMAQPSNATMLRGVKSLADLPRDDRLPIAHALLSAGVRGKEVNILLERQFHASSGSQTHEDLDYALVEALVRGHGEVREKSLSTAAGNGDLRAVNLLVSGSPNAAAMGSALAAAQTLHDPDLRYNITESLLRAGAVGDAVHEALIKAVGNTTAAISLMALLVEMGGADLNFRGGEALIRCIQDTNIQGLSIILRRSPDAQTAGRMLHQAIEVHDRERRSQIMRMVLLKDVSQMARDQVLIKLVSEKPYEKPLVELLLSFHASVDFREGRALYIAIQNEQFELATMLILKGLQSIALSKALQAANNLKTEKRRLKFLELVLHATKGRLQDQVSAMLQEAVAESVPPYDLCKLFLDYGASLDHENATAFNIAIQRQNLKAVVLFLGRPFSAETLRQIFDLAWETQGQDRCQLLSHILNANITRKILDLDAALVTGVHEDPISADVVCLLLEHGASVHFRKNRSLLHCVRVGNTETLKALLESATNRKEVAAVFETVINNTGLSELPGYMRCLEMLLEQGAFGDAVTHALALAVKVPAFDATIFSLIRALIRHGADTQHTMEDAARRGNLTLMQVTLESGISPALYSKVFPLFVAAEATSEYDAVTLLGDVEKRYQSKFDVSKQHPTLPPIVFIILKRWPHSTRLLRRIISYDTYVSMSEKRSLVIPGDTGSELLTVLLWAIVHMGDKIHVDAIEQLLNAGESVNFAAKDSLQTPIQVAASRGRPDIVKLLLMHGADVTDRDINGKTALFLATNTGSFDTLSMLIEAGAPVNDGSLQEAARNCQAEPVRALLKRGHLSGNSSRLHDGRDALEEICLMCNGFNRGIIQRTIELLSKGRSSQTIGYKGKSCLLLALDNQQASVEVTGALLDVYTMDYVNSESHLYRQDGFVYSPLSYIKKGLQKSPRSQANLLEGLLGPKCLEIYYRESGEQPLDMKNAPPQISKEYARQQLRRQRLAEDAEEKRTRQRDIEEEHQAHLRREREAHQQRQQLDQQLHTLVIDRENELAEARLVTVRRAADAERQMAKRKLLEDEAAADHRRATEVEHERMISNQRLSSARAEGQQQLEYKSRLAIQDQTILDSQVNAQRKIDNYRLQIEQQNRREAESASRMHYERENTLLQEKRNGLRQQQKLIESQRELAQLAQRAHQLQITENDYYTPD